MSKDTQTVAKLRFQTYDGGQVHVHDDSNGVKFIGNAKTFKKDVEQALTDLDKTDTGVAVIEGTSTNVLLLIKYDRMVQAVVNKDKDDVADIKKFLKGI